MSLPLFRTTLRRHWLMWLLFTAILVMYQVVIAYMYDPDSMQSMDALLKLLPGGMIAAFGFVTGMTSLTGFIVSYYFGFLAGVMALVYTLLVANALVARLVDDGSMSYLLTTPTARRRVLGTQMAYLYLSLVLMQAVAGGLSAVMIAQYHPGLLDIGGFWRVTGYSCLVSLAVASFCMLCSCTFSTSRAAVGCSAGVGVAFVLLQMLGNMGGKAAVLKRFTPYGWMDGFAVMNGEADTLLVSVCLLVLTALLSSAAYVIFTKKQLAI